jgi:hypothetical protein
VRTSNVAEPVCSARRKRSSTSRQDFVVTQHVKKIPLSVDPENASPCSLKQFIWLYPKRICYSLKLHVLGNSRIRHHLRNGEVNGTG